MRKSLLFVLALLFLALSPGLALAQRDGGPISFGETVTGALETNDPWSIEQTNATADSYTFSGVAGQRVTIALQSTFFDSFLILIGPNRNIVARDDDSGGNLNALISEFSLATTGTYTIEVTGYSYGLIPTGLYTLSLIAEGAAPTPIPAPTPVAPVAGAQPINFGQTVSGELTSTDARSRALSNVFADSYTFYGVAGQRVTIALNSTTYDPFLALIAPSGGMIRWDDDSGEGFNSLISGFTLPETGTYTIEATSAFQNATGSYTLSLNTEGAAPTPTPAPAPSPLLPPSASASARPTEGTTPLTISFTGQGSDPDGGSVVYSWDFGDGTPQSTQQNPSHTYQNPGDYTATLTVTDDEGEQATSTIRITVTSPTPAPTPVAGPRVVNFGQTLSGELTSTDLRSLWRTGSFADIYSFAGAAGQLMTIAMNASYDTYLILYDEAGNLIASDDNSGDGLQALIRGFALPFTGDYNIEATTFGSNLTGSYTLSLNAEGAAPTQGTITTVAGTGTAGYSGDGGPATQALLGFPQDVAVDGAGNLYIAIDSNYRVRKVDTNGIITTMAGTGTWGYSGDGGPATQAQLSSAAGIAVDSAGDLYIADQGNERIRKVDTSGIITTVAGTGRPSYSGDGGPATQAALMQPVGVEVDSSGNLYIADRDNNRVRKVDSSGIITTVAGGGPTGPRAGGYSGDGGPATQAQLANPTGVAVDSSGNLYIADLSNDRVRKVDSNGIITTVAGTGIEGYSGDGGPATQAQLANPNGVAVDSAGNLYIVDSHNHRIRRVDPSSIITTVAGSGPTGTGAGRFSGDGGPATQAQLNLPADVAVDGSGNLYIADYLNYRVRKVTFGPAPSLSPISSAPSHTGTIDMDATIIQNQRRVTVTVNDPDLNTSAASAQTTRVEVNSTTSIGTPIIVSLTETGIDTGIFTGTFATIGDGTDSGTVITRADTITATRQIAVSNGDGVTATYTDQQDSAGSVRTVTVSRIVRMTDGTMEILAADGTPLTNNQASAGDRVLLRYTDPDLNTNADLVQSIAAAFFSTTDLTGISVVMFETGVNTGVFTKDILLSSTTSAASTSLRVSTGDTITARFVDTTPSNTPSGFTSEGSARMATASIAGPGAPFLSAPIASLMAAPTEGTAPLAVNFTGQGSDPDGGSVVYFWDFGDRTQQSREQNPSHTYQNPGSYTALLIVTDDEGQQARASVIINVEPPLPSAPGGEIIRVTGTVRVKPQVIAAGFDPTLVDLNDDSFDIIAIVRPGAAPIRSVTVTQNQGQFSFRMNHSYTISNGDQLWRATHNFPRGSIRETFRALWGDRPGEFNVSVIDEGQQRHSFPDLEFGNTPALGFEVTSPWAGEGVEPGIRRVKPQVMAAGFSPTLIDVTDDSFDVIALVRQGAVPISGVTLTQNLGPFSISMNFLETLPNGDQLYKATFNFERGSIPNQVFRALWGDQPNEFNVTVIDQAQQQHSFPDLVFGNNPAID